MKLKTLLVLLLAGTALAGCHRLDPNSPEYKRQAVFKEMLKTSEDMGGMLRGRIPFDADKFRSNSTKLGELADKPWQYFPTTQPPADKVESDDTRAKAEIWQRNWSSRPTPRPSNRPSAPWAKTPAMPRRRLKASARTSPRWKTPARPATRNSARSDGRFLVGAS